MALFIVRNTHVLFPFPCIKFLLHPWHLGDPPGPASPPPSSLSPLPRLQHPTRKLQFLLASKGRSDVQAVGGNWEPVDGAHPERDPQALVRTAVRTFKEATGLDISDCSQVRGWGVECMGHVAEMGRKWVHR